MSYWTSAILQKNGEKKLFVYADDFAGYENNKDGKEMLTWTFETNYNGYNAIVAVPVDMPVDLHVQR